MAGIDGARERAWRSGALVVSGVDSVIFVSVISVSVASRNTSSGWLKSTSSNRLPPYSSSMSVVTNEARDCSLMVLPGCEVTLATASDCGDFVGSLEIGA